MQRTEGSKVPAWAVSASLGLSLLAVAIAAYLTVTHFTDPTALACPDTGVVNCTLVTTSPESLVFGVPLAVLGVIWAAGMSALCLPWCWRSPAASVARARVIGSSAGAAMVLYLVYTELFRIGAICLWCTAMHVTAIALFGVVLGERTGTAGRSNPRAAVGSAGRT